jgi:hypothetical protein
MDVSVSLKKRSFHWSSRAIFFRPIKGFATRHAIPPTVGTSHGQATLSTVVASQVRLRHPQWLLRMVRLRHPQWLLRMVRLRHPQAVASHGQATSSTSGCFAWSGYVIYSGCFAWSGYVIHKCLLRMVRLRHPQWLLRMVRLRHPQWLLRMVRLRYLPKKHNTKNITLRQPWEQMMGWASTSFVHFETSTQLSK